MSTLFAWNGIVGNVGSGEDLLSSMMLPANAMASSLHTLWFRAFGRFAPTTTNKRVKVYFGSAVVFDSLTMGDDGLGLLWQISGHVHRVEVSKQHGWGTLLSQNGGPSIPSTQMWGVINLSENLAAPLVVKIVGRATHTDDVQLFSFAVGMD